MRRLTLLIAIVTALALPASALAAESANDVSNGLTGSHRFAPAQSVVSQGHGLLFTGEDALFLVVIGVLIAGGGVSLYRHTRRGA